MFNNIFITKNYADLGAKVKVKARRCIFLYRAIKISRYIYIYSFFQYQKLKIKITLCLRIKARSLSGRLLGHVVFKKTEVE